ncbi:MAG TPA: TolC family protein, partial [Terriglobales bacterium]|nr:TolC family protein [Terriglobales bacterium]
MVVKEDGQMMSRCAVLLLASLCAAISSLPHGAAAQPADLAALEEIPNYSARLATQWRSDDLPRDAEAWLADVSHFGRLRDLTAPQQLTLPDCVALAIANNTQLQLDRLGPLGARVRIRQAHSIFDSAIFANAGIDRYRRQSSSYTAVVGATTPEGEPIPLEDIDTGALGFFLGPPTSEQRRFNGNVGIRKLLVTGGLIQGQWRNQRRKSNSPFQALSPEYISELELSINQPLLRDFGLRFTTLQIRIAELQSDAAARQYEAALSNLVKRVETAYWLLVGARANVSVRELGLQVANELQRQNEGKFNVGTVPRTAVLEARADVARREADLIEANKLFTNARDALRTVLNVKDPSSDSLIIVEPIDKPTVEHVQTDLDRSLQTALEHRAELAAARVDLEGSSMQLRAAANQLLPRLDAVG